MRVFYIFAAVATAITVSAVATASPFSHTFLQRRDFNLTLAPPGKPGPTDISKACEQQCSEVVKVSADCDKSKSVKHCESRILGLCKDETSFTTCMTCTKEGFNHTYDEFFNTLETSFKQICQQSRSSAGDINGIHKFAAVASLAITAIALSAAL